MLCAIKVHTRANQLLPQILMDQLDTLPSHYRHIGICMKKFDADIFFQSIAGM